MNYADAPDLPNEIIVYIGELCPNVFRELLAIPFIARDRKLRQRILNSITIISKEGNGIIYRVNGKLHREDGPAIRMQSKFSYSWFCNGKLHRIGGPAIYNGDDQLLWYENGIPRNNYPEKNGPVSITYNPPHRRSQGGVLVEYERGQNYIKKHIYGTRG